MCYVVCCSMVLCAILYELRACEIRLKVKIAYFDDDCVSVRCAKLSASSHNRGGWGSDHAAVKSTVEL